MSSSQQLLLGEGAGGGGYQISRSLRFNSADSAYLNRTPASASNRKTWTWSGWVKLGTFSSDFNLISARTGITAPFGLLRIYNATNGYTLNYAARDSSNVLIADISTNAVFRDPSAWYHIVVSLDTTQATSSDRYKVYVNGVSQSLTTSTAATLNSEGAINGVYEHNIGKQAASAVYANGYLTEINFIDGQALTPSSFGQNDPNTGVWSPIRYTGTYGTNGFYLNFSDNSGTTSTTLGKDYSGNGNNWTPNNFSVTAGAGNDSLVDTPTPYGTDTGAGGEVRGNYCTLNPLNTASAITLANGNLEYSTSTTTNVGCAIGTIGVSSGKWYWEGTPTSLRGLFGVSLPGTNIATDPASQVLCYYYRYDGNKYNGSGSAYGASYTTNDVIGVALDLDAGTLTFYKNGVSQGTAFSSLPANTYFPLTGDDATSVNVSGIVNFGQRPFAYTPPAGFLSLCSTNLPTPTIGFGLTNQGDDYFNTVLYTGNGSTQSITGVGFQPDFVWVKGRNNIGNHLLSDAVRGALKSLATNLTSAEIDPDTNGLTSFDSDGFSAGSATRINGSGNTYVAWNWKANGSGGSNTAGSITSTVSANTTSGFSIVTYTGTGANATVGHGLGIAPSMVIVKARSAVENWPVYHASLGAGGQVYLSVTDAYAAATTRWNNTAPTSTVFSVGTTGNTNGSGVTFVAYCFAPVAGYSAFGSYTGNGSADGPFVFTNHRPAFLLIKRTDTTSNWTILDLAREGYNVDNDPLYPNLSNAEGTTDLADILSNGFKLRSTDASVNANTGTYIYMSLASNPFKYSLAR